MWISFKHVSDLFSISKDSVDSLRTENASLKTANAHLEDELRSARLNSDWLRVQFNQLQLERTALMERIYELRLPTPQLTVASKAEDPTKTFQDALFADLGDEEARKLGLPTYD